MVALAFSGFREEAAVCGAENAGMLMSTDSNQLRHAGHVTFYMS
jgi:hypothetical protein